MQGGDFNWILGWQNSNTSSGCSSHTHLVTPYHFGLCCLTPSTLTVQGGGFSWILGWQNGAPPLGWAQTIAYLALPVALVASQFVTQRIMQPPSQDPQQQQSAAFLKFLPFVIGVPACLPAVCALEVPCRRAGLSVVCPLVDCSLLVAWQCCPAAEQQTLCAGWFSLNVPSGLTLYWFTNNLLSTGQQVSGLAVCLTASLASSYRLVPAACSPCAVLSCCVWGLCR